jgi:hypothetical protein
MGIGESRRQRWFVWAAMLGRLVGLGCAGRSPLRVLDRWIRVRQTRTGPIDFPETIRGRLEPVIPLARNERTRDPY